MLRILGTSKIVPDLELLSEEDWTVTKDNLVDTGFVKTVWNCFDESALEMMLKLSDSSESFGLSIQLDAVTVGGAVCDKYLKTLYALGFHEAVRIETEQEIQFWPELTAGLITEYWSQYGSQDVIVMGQKSADGANGKTPFLVAESLGWPCITQVTGIALDDEEHLRVTHNVDEGSCTRRVKIPCVLSVGDAPDSYLRVPTLKARMSLGKREVIHYSMESFEAYKKWEASNASSELMGMEPVYQRREGVLVEGETVEQKVENLYQSYLKERLDKL